MEPKPELAAPASPIKLDDLFNIATWQDKIAWEPFRDGVDIYHLYGNGIEGPSAALIRYRKGAAVPLHLHTGYEHILVLTGSQRDENGLAPKGTLTVNPPGTQHSLVSEAGCIVLAIYEKPVRFLA